jgi:hypothetical protein
MPPAFLECTVLFPTKFISSAIPVICMALLLILYLTGFNAVHRTSEFMMISVMFLKSENFMSTSITPEFIYLYMHSWHKMLKDMSLLQHQHPPNFTYLQNKDWWFSDIITKINHSKLSLDFLQFHFWNCSCFAKPALLYTCGSAPSACILTWSNVTQQEISTTKWPFDMKRNLTRRLQFHCSAWLLCLQMLKVSVIAYKALCGQQIQYEDSLSQHWTPFGKERQQSQLYYRNKCRMHTMKVWKFLFGWANNFMHT